MSRFYTAAPVTWWVIREAAVDFFPMALFFGDVQVNKCSARCSTRCTTTLP